MSKLTDVIAFAAKAHEGQIRKLNNQPYIFHPCEVGQIVSSMTDDEDVVCAAILHDTVEDTRATLGEIEEKFGKRVAYLVALETEDKRENKDKSKTWRIRKEESLKELENCGDIDAKKIWLGDKLSNIRSMYRTHLLEGDSMWNHFNNKNPEDHEWYYESIMKLLKDLSGYSVYREYCAIVEALFGDK